MRRRYWHFIANSAKQRFWAASSCPGKGTTLTGRYSVLLMPLLVVILAGWSPLQAQRRLPLQASCRSPLQIQAVRLAWRWVALDRTTLEDVKYRRKGTDSTLSFTPTQLQQIWQKGTLQGLVELTAQASRPATLERGQRIWAPSAYQVAFPKPVLVHRPFFQGLRCWVQLLPHGAMREQIRLRLDMMITNGQLQAVKSEVGPLQLPCVQGWHLISTINLVPGKVTLVAALPSNRWSPRVAAQQQLALLVCATPLSTALTAARPQPAGTTSTPARERARLPKRRPGRQPLVTPRRRLPHPAYPAQRARGAADSRADVHLPRKQLGASRGTAENATITVGSHYGPPILPRSYPSLLDAGPAEEQVRKGPNSSYRPPIGNRGSARLEFKWVLLPLALADSILARHTRPNGALSPRGLRLMVQAVRTGPGRLEAALDLLVSPGTSFALALGQEQRVLRGYRCHEKVTGNQLHSVLVPRIRSCLSGLLIRGYLWPRQDTLALHMQDTQLGQNHAMRGVHCQITLPLPAGATCVITAWSLVVKKQVLKRLLLIKLVR